MIIACPKCQQRHDLSGRKPGETFSCACGNVLEAQKKGGGKWLVVLAILAACVVPCLIMAAIAIPNFIRYGLRAKAGEAKVNLAAIRTAERVHFATANEFVAAGPVPARVPGKVKADFVPDPGFEAIPFKPEGRVYYQYEVRVTGPRSAVIIARGDVDGDGKVAEFQMALEPEGPAEVKDLTPGEF